MLANVPTEIRLIIYETFLDEHRRVRSNNQQPNNTHLRLLRVCRIFEIEAGDLFRTYVSLAHERQINAFIRFSENRDCTFIRWADVANDGRFFRAEGVNQANPVSNLHVALRRMPLLKSLRMFECRQGIPMGVHRLNRFSLQVESAMFPSGSAPALESYELYLNPDTRIHVSTVVPSAKLLTLRLSGTCQLHEHPPCPSLRHLTITSVKGNYFDTTLLGNMFRGAELSSFAYAHGDRLGFEMRDNQLRSLVLHGGPGAHLQKLVLLSCNRLTTEVLDDVLRQLPHLQHLALSFIVVDELAHNFVLAFPATLSVAKLQITHARYAKPFLEEERMLCEALEEQVLQRHPPPQHVCAAFAPWLLEEGDREFRWIGISECIGFSLTIGAWEQDELV